MGIVMGIVFFLLWGFFWSGALFFDGPLSSKLGYAILAWAPLGLMAWFHIHRAVLREKQSGALLEALGVARGAGRDHAEEGTSIAINAKKGLIGVQVGQSFKIYPYDQVRGWEIRAERAGVVVPAFGVANGIAATGAQARLAREAAANTGLFIQVKDVDSPVWRIAMKDEATRARWMEILRQEINENGTVASR